MYTDQKSQHVHNHFINEFITFSARRTQSLCSTSSTSILNPFNLGTSWVCVASVVDHFQMRFTDSLSSPKQATGGTYLCVSLTI